jgi:hypothetical protein
MDDGRRTEAERALKAASGLAAGEWKWWHYHVSGGIALIGVFMEGCLIFRGTSSLRIPVELGRARFTLIESQDGQRDHLAVEIGSEAGVFRIICRQVAFTHASAGLKTGDD